MRSTAWWPVAASWQQKSANCRFILLPVMFPVVSVGYIMEPRTRTRIIGCPKCRRVLTCSGKVQVSVPNPIYPTRIFRVTRMPTVGWGRGGGINLTHERSRAGGAALRATKRDPTRGAAPVGRPVRRGSAYERLIPRLGARDSLYPFLVSLSASLIAVFLDWRSKGTR